MSKHHVDQVSTASRIGHTVLATHLLPSIVVTAMTTALAYGSGQRSSLWLLIPAILFGQFCIGWTNDYLDRQRDKIAGRINKPIVAGYVQARTVRRLAIAALVVAVLFSLAYSVGATLIYIVALASALLYNFRLKNSILSVVSYIVSFGLLPVYVGLGSTPAFVPNIWIVIALSFWGVGVHIQNVIPDFEYDAKTGIKGAANYLTRFNATLLCAVALSFSVVALSVAFVISAPLFVWAIFSVFAGTTLILIVSLLLHKMDIAFKVTMVMTGIVTILIMISGPYLNS